MTHHDEEAHTFQYHIRIDVHEGIAAQFNPALFVFLNGKLGDHRTVVRCIVLGEIGGISAKFHAKHFGYLELQLEVCEDVPGWQGQYFLVAAILVGDDIFPVDGT